MLLFAMMCQSKPTLILILARLISYAMVCIFHDLLTLPKILIPEGARHVLVGNNLSSAGNNNSVQ